MRISIIFVHSAGLCAVFSDHLLAYFRPAYPGVALAKADGGCDEPSFPDCADCAMRHGVSGVDVFGTVGAGVAEA